MKTLALFVLLLVIGSAHAHASGKPDLVIAATAATETCSGSEQTYAVSITVANHGSASSPAASGVAAVFVHDSATPHSWTGSAGLPAIAANGSAVVEVDLVRHASGKATAPKMPLAVIINQGHWIKESDFNNDAGQITTVRSAGCTTASAASVAHSTNKGHAGATPHPSPSMIVLHPTKVIPFGHPTASPGPPSFVAAPTGLTYTTNPSVCTAHVGLAGAFICPTVIGQTGLLLLVWNWAACKSANCVQQIQGFHIYSVTMLKLEPITTLHTTMAHQVHYAGYTRTLVDTQTNPSITLRGISPFSQGECFVVTAFTTSRESNDSGTHCVGQSAYVAAPWNVRTIQNIATCEAVFGSSSGQCDGYISTGHTVLYWNWNPCGGSGCVSSVDGYNVYQAGGPEVAHQSNGGIRGADLGPFKVPECFIVRAYHGSVQSDPSSPLCVNSQVVSSPPPTAAPPPAPMHVEIDITDDSFPSNTVVHVGGSVTWVNKDTDAHDVVSSDSSIVGDLPPGESFTYKFPRVGPISYHCDYHQGMTGMITVVSH